MKTTFITTIPDKAGGFLAASTIISKNKGNIVRVNYNKAVDAHIMFIDVEADNTEMKRIKNELRENGFLADNIDPPKVLVVEFKLLDVPGSVKPVLEILNDYKINISYISSDANESEFQYFKMGLFIDNPSLIKELLDKISELCHVRILEYDATEKILDNTVFYLRFATDIRNKLKLSQHKTNEMIIQSNMLMQMLDEQNKQPFKTFLYINKFVDFVNRFHGENFKPIIKKMKISDKVTLHLIEPPTGSNIYIMECENELLFVDGGFCCYSEEMTKVIYNLFPDFNKRIKNAIITHADIDHIGILPLMDKVYVNRHIKENFMLEQNGENNFREQHPYSSPYCRISKIITDYVAPPLDKLEIISELSNDGEKPLVFIGSHSFYDLSFDIYEGSGGHVKGEMIFVEKSKKIIFTGDNYVNIRGFSPEQKEFNKLAPYLMTSVNMDSKKATEVRNEILKMDNTILCPGHGDWCIRID